VSALSRELTEGPQPNKNKYPPRLHHGASEKPSRYNPSDLGRILRSGNYPVEIDYVAISFPVRKVYDYQDVFWHERISTARASMPSSLSSKVLMGQGTVNISYQLKSSGQIGYVMFNPSTIVYGKKSPNAATLPETLSIIEDVLDIVERHVEIGGSRDAVKLSRIDLCATFSPVSNIQQLLMTANKFTLTPRSKNNCYSSKKGYETVRNQLKRRTVSIYDKSLQSRLKTPTLRIEVSLKREALKDLCPTISNLEEELCRKMFTSNVDPWISAFGSLPHLPLYSIQQSPKDFDLLLRLIGWAYLEECGIPQRMTEYDRRRMREFKKKYPFEVLSDLLVPKPDTDQSELPDESGGS
jgi:hypothetical protein